jgi:hypothetical protein
MYRQKENRNVEAEIPNTLVALALSVVFGTTVSLAFAQDAGKPAATPDTGMMGGRGGGMMGMMSGVDPAEMKRMVENCNRMMESMMRDQPTTPPVPPAAPQPEPKG